VEYRPSVLTSNDWTYIAGFGDSPDGKDLQWQYAADRITNIKSCSAAPSTGVESHPIAFGKTDISSTYWYPSGNMDLKLHGGTSGSIAIDQNNKVVGIHWGEWEGSESVCFLTSNNLDVRFDTNHTNIIDILKVWIAQI
jgi:hypothetical protein